ncbi:MAG: sporulation protein YqfD [Oscillospiraceae bacterium]|nr:sporulation protein YqfD [Oscillospiraceae bacterium]
MGWITFSAEGTQLSAFREALRKNGIACRAQQIRSNIFYAQTAAKNMRRLTGIAAETDMALCITARHGLRFQLLPFRKRFGLLCGLLCGAAFLYWCNATVRSIEISGNVRVQDAEILSALESLGVGRGSRFRDLPYTYLEQQMRLCISDIEWITMRQEGGRLIVDLTEEREPPALENDRFPTNVTAAVPAQITKMDIHGGHAVKKVGDTVKAGELLISGVHEDPPGVSHYSHADGIVEGIYPAEFTVHQAFVEELPVRGTTVTETVLDLFGKRFSLTLGFTPPEDSASFIYEEDAEPLILCGQRLPVTLLRCRYTQRETAITVFSEAEVRAMLEEAAAHFEQNFHAADTVISKKAEFLRDDLGISLNINYVFEGVIGKTSEIFVKLS